MSETPDEPGTPERPAAAAAPPHGPGPEAPTPTQQWAAAAPPAARRSIWGEAMSTTGGKLAVIVAGASLGLVALLTAGLVVGGLRSARWR